MKISNNVYGNAWYTWHKQRKVYGWKKFNKSEIDC